MKAPLHSMRKIREMIHSHLSRNPGSIQRNPLPDQEPAPGGSSPATEAAKSVQTKSCVVFASWVPRRSLELGRYYLNLLEKYHCDSDIYLGINYGSAPEWVDLVWRSKLNIRFGLVPKDRHINSDVAGFIEALSQLRTSGKTYDVIWFAHTKGASYKNFKASRTVREHFEQNFWSQRASVEKLFRDFPNIGLVGNELLVNKYEDHNTASARLTEFYPFKYKSIGYFVVGTYYAMRGSVVHEFIDRCHPDFFRKNLEADLGFHRWFFESGFNCISDRMGYEPFWLNTAQDLFVKELEMWRKDKEHHKPTAYDW